MVNARRGVRPATVCRSILFTALLATEAFVHKGDRCCYIDTKDLLSTCITDRGSSFLLLVPPWASIPKQAGFQDAAFPLPLSKGQDSLIVLSWSLAAP